MLSFERRWALAALEGFAPEGAAGLSPRAGEVDYLGAMSRMLERGTRLSALGLRAALYIATLAPLILLGRLRLLGSYSPVERSELLCRLLAHRVFAVRELVLLLKLCACLALFHSPSLRARSGYDAPAHDDDEHAEVEQSGERPKMRLAVVADRAGAPSDESEVA